MTTNSSNGRADGLGALVGNCSIRIELDRLIASTCLTSTSRSKRKCVSEVAVANITGVVISVSAKETQAICSKRKTEQSKTNFLNKIHACIVKRIINCAMKEQIGIGSIGFDSIR